MILPPAIPLGRNRGQQRLQPLPLLISQIVTIQGFIHASGLPESVIKIYGTG
jgi:hypothetical protein